MSRHMKSGFAALATDSDSDEEQSPSLNPSTPVPAAAASGAGEPAAVPSALPSYADYWTLFDNVDGPRETQPCRCCAVGFAVEGDYWICATTGRRWLILGAPPDPEAKHDGDMCPGNCRWHPLMTPELARWNRGTMAGISLAEMLDQEMDYEFSLLPAAEQQKRRAAAEAESKAMMRNIVTGSEAHRIARVQEAQERRYAQRGKIWEPCKKLYNCQGGGAEGGVARPTTLNVCTECWRYEYTDPRIYAEAMEQGATEEEARRAAHVVKHQCNWLHPGEEGWQPEWDTDRTSRVAAERVRLLQAARPPAPTQPPQRAAAGGAGGGPRHGWNTPGPRQQQQRGGHGGHGGHGQRSGGAAAGGAAPRASRW